MLFTMNSVLTHLSAFLFSEVYLVLADEKKPVMLTLVSPFLICIT